MFIYIYTHTELCIYQPQACADDSNWHDADGDGCLIYDGFIADGKLTLDEACNYGEGDAKKYCRKTCGTCKAAAAFMDGQDCKDIECVSKWQEQVGTCFACSDWPNYCADPVFKHECPVTCGTRQGQKGGWHERGEGSPSMPLCNNFSKHESPPFSISLLALA